MGKNGEKGRRGMCKRNMLLLIPLAAALTFGGCGLNGMIAVYDDDVRIVSDYDTYNKTNYRQNREGDAVTVSAGKMEGMYTVWSSEVSEDAQADISWSVSVDSGKLKLVFIAPDDTLSTIVEVSEGSEGESSESAVLQLKEGKNRIKLVAAENTKFDLKFSVSEGK